MRKIAIKIIASGRASSYCSHTSPPPTTKATKAGAPKILLVEHWVAMTDKAMLSALPLLEATK